jgi:hypothetical protein
MPLRRIRRGFSDWVLSTGPLAVVPIFAVACHGIARILLGPSHEASIFAAWFELIALFAGGFIGLLAFWFVSGSDTIRREEQGNGGGHKNGG